VVDDAIIVVENVNRHLEEGLSHLEAALVAARELAGPIVAMTVVLAAVYVPIGFQGGITGALFTEFAFTLVGAVTLSAVIALTLSPMLCSKMLQAHAEVTSGWERRLTAFIDTRFDAVRTRYAEMLHESLNTIAVTLVFACVVVVSIYFLYTSAKTELAPQEDQGFMAAILTASPNSTVQQRAAYFTQARAIIRAIPGVAHVMQQDESDFKFNGIVLKPWSQRKDNSSKIQNELQERLGAIAGVSAATFQLPPLPVGFGFPIQFVLESTRNFDQMFPVTQQFFETAQQSGLFAFLDTDLKIDVPQATVQIDRDKAAQLGLSMADIGSAMSDLLGGGYVNYFALSGRSYKVTPQVQQRFRLNPDQVLDYHVRAADGTSVPLSTVATITTRTIPESLPRFQQLNAVTMGGVVAPGVSVGDAIAYLQNLAAQTLPSDFSVDYAGTSRQYVHESSGFIVTFAFALIVIFLSLAALFESFRDPVIILVSVPMSIAGALLFITLGVGGATVNIYTQVGLVTLMGLVSKHGILIVQFANTQQQLGHDKREAVEIAATVRLRPILMTTAAMVLGVVPLLLATGAGAEARFQMGLVIASGIAIGTLFTLFVVPSAYVLLAAEHRKKAAIGDTVPV
jgi:multidrug efflux pump